MNRKNFISGAGGAILITLLLIYFIKPGLFIQSENSSTKYPLSLPTPDSIYTDTLSGPQKDAFQAFERKDYELAKTLFNGLPSSDEQRFYLAMAHWELGEESKAILLWMVQANQPQAQFHQEAQWYLAIAYAKRNQLDQSKELLEKIVQQPEHPFIEEAKNLFKELK